MNLFCFAFSDKMKGCFSFDSTLQSSYWVSFIHCLPTQYIFLLFGVVLLAPNKDPFYTYMGCRKSVFSCIAALILYSN